MTAAQLFGTVSYYALHRGGHQVNSGRSKTSGGVTLRYPIDEAVSGSDVPTQPTVPTALQRLQIPSGTVPLR